jgi:hypothetical protein
MKTPARDIPHWPEGGSTIAFRSGILVRMSEEDRRSEPGEPEPGSDGDGQPADGERADPAATPVPGSPVFDATRIMGKWQQQFGAPIARRLLPQLEVFQAQQRIAENLIRSMGGFDRLQRQILAAQPRIEAFRAQQLFAESVFKNINAVSGLQRQVLGNLSQIEAFRSFARSVVPELAKLASLIPEDWFPRNWEQAPDLDIDAAIGIIVDEGIPLVWVPRAAIVAELVAAADADARDEVLLSSRDEIAEDCLAVLGEITAPDLKPLAELAAEAVTALRDGHRSSAQALAGNVFDTLLRDATRRGVIFTGPPVGYFKYDKVRKQITPVSDDTVIRRFRADCVLSASLPALQPYDPSDPPPARFIRHATAHCVRPEQYTPVNAVVAAMLMTSMLREAQSSGW